MGICCYIGTVFLWLGEKASSSYAVDQFFLHCLFFEFFEIFENPKSACGPGATGDSADQIFIDPYRHVSKYFQTFFFISVLFYMTIRHSLNTFWKEFKDFEISVSCLYYPFEFRSFQIRMLHRGTGFFKKGNIYQ